MADYRLYLFGRPRLEQNGSVLSVERNKALALLAYLALRNQPVGRDRLAAFFWPDSGQSAARANLRTALAALKQVLGAGLFDTERETIALRHNTLLWIDAIEFRSLSAQVMTGLASPPSNVRLGQLAAAVDLYTDDFLAGFGLRDCPDFEEWQREQAEQLRRELTIVLEQLVQGHLAKRAYPTAERYARRWVELEPYHEPAYRALMQVYLHSGDKAAAVRVYQRCCQVLRDELGITPAEETTALYMQSRSSASDGPPGAKEPAAPAAAFPTLPIPPTPFVGREAELAQIAQALAEPTCRMLTVIGPGGIGKTRLALQAGIEQVQSFADGVYFVSLASLPKPDLLATTLVESLHLSGATPAPPEEVLLNYLSRRHILLLLDNFEHLRRGKVLLRAILAQCPQVKLLLTSRERLNLREEWLIPLQGLGLPPDIPSAGLTAARTPDDAIQYDSIRLFIQCARRIQPDFAANKETIVAIEQICRTVEGYPLAIELAAAWLRIMPCHTIAEALQSGLDFLTTSWEDVPERHRSMRATLEHSWQLLASDEQDALCRLSIFRGGIPPAAAQTTASASTVMLLALADKSWLSASAGGRLQMHEFVRQFCEDKIAVIGLDAEDLRYRHAHYFAARLSYHESQIHGSGQVAAMHEIMTEIDNIRAGWSWAVGCIDLALIDQFIECLYWISMLRGWYHETLANFSHAIQTLEQRQTTIESTGRPFEERYILARLMTRIAGLHERLGSTTDVLALCEKSLEYLSARPQDQRWLREQAYASAMRCYWYYQVGNMADAVAVARSARQEFQAAGDTYGEAFVLWIEGLATDNLGERTIAMNLLAQANTKLEVSGEQYLRAMVLNCLASIQSAVRDLNQSRQNAEISLALRRTLGDQRGIAACQSQKGFDALRAGEPVEAKQLLESSLGIAGLLKDHHLWTVALQGLGCVAYLSGEWQVAWHYFERSLAITQHGGRRMWAGVSHCGMGITALGEGNPALARAHFLEALNLAREMDDALLTSDALAGIAELFLHSGRPVQAVQLLTFVQAIPGSMLPVRKDGVLLSQLEEMLPPALYQSAAAQGQAMTLEDALLVAREHGA